MEQKNGSGELGKQEMGVLRDLFHMDFEFRRKEEERTLQHYKEREKYVRENLPGLDESVRKYLDITDQMPFDEELPSEELPSGEIAILAEYSSHPVMKMLFTEHWLTLYELKRFHGQGDEGDVGGLDGPARL